MTAYLDVLLRGFGLVSQAVAVGGVFFIVWVLRPVRLTQEDFGPAVDRSLRLLAAGAVGAALAQCLVLLLQLQALADERGWPITAVVATTYFVASVIRIVTCVGLAVGCRFVRRRPTGVAARPTGAAARPLGRLPQAALVGASVVVALSSAGMSHAAGRLDHRVLLLGLDALHQLAGAVWIGGLLHLVTAAFRRDEGPYPVAALQRFSAMAFVAVATLVLAGIGLSVAYIDNAHALVGTAYGMMVITKGAILAALLVLGAFNFLTVRRLSHGLSIPLVRVRRFVEVEFGLGLTVLFAAASLTSLPPAVDVVSDRATLADVGTRFSPTWPSFRSPKIEELPVADRDAPRTPEDRAWSEYNHHWAGLIVISMGVLATLQRLSWARWARHWPLIFLGLAGFLFMRNDPEAWPLGPFGFWETMVDPVVLQHRLFVLLVIAFGVFEWMVRTERFRSPRWALVFPILCAIGGGLLLTHSHSADNLKEQFLIEVTHTPLGVLGALVGWSRWLELRLPAPDRKLPGRLWAFGLTLVGVLLLMYRES